MAVSLETISQWLKEDDTKHSLDKEREVITFGAKGDVQTAHFIRTKENGELFDYQIQIRENGENLTIPKVIISGDDENAILDTVILMPLSTDLIDDR